MSIEALKQALEALERSFATCFDQYAHQQAMSQPDHFINQAITSLRQAIVDFEKQEQDEHTVALIKECRDAFAEELSAWDIYPPLHHIQQGHDNCVKWLAVQGIKENT